MKKFTYLFATAAVLAACSGNQEGYTVKGTVEGAADGEMVYLQKPEGRQLVTVDSAAIQNGEFVFKGTQDTATVRYLSYKPNSDEGRQTDFFLENGNINITLGAEQTVLSGTPSNDTIQLMYTQIRDITEKMKPIYAALSDSTLSEEEREAKMEEVQTQLNGYAQQIEDLARLHMTQNIANPVGAHLLKGMYQSMEADELDTLLAQIPAQYTDDAILQIKERAAKMKATAVGQKFTDFEMSTPDGKPVKLSDYVGKGKLVLVDFWASWCGPCRREMPEVVELYKQYKNKGFEVVGVSLDRDAEAWKKGIKDLKITWPQMSDLKYWNCEGAQIYAVNSIPHTMLIDGEGTIVARGLRGEELKEKIAEILK